MKPKSALAGTTTTLICTISGIKDLMSVVWRDEELNKVENGTYFTVYPGLSNCRFFDSTKTEQQCSVLY